MAEIIPSILVNSRDEFEQKLRTVENYVKTVHVDILDGSLFPQTSWFDARAVGAMNTPVKYELHLMVENPLPIIKEWAELVSNSQRAIIHAEIDRPIAAVLERIRQWYKMETGLAINPETPTEEIKPYLNSTDSLLIMGVHPGKSGQEFQGEYILEKIKSLHKENKNLPIACDGGITLENAPGIISAGCCRLITASAVFKADNPINTLRAFQNLK